MAVDFNTPEQIATAYGGDLQKIAQAAQLGVITPLLAVLAGQHARQNQERLRSAQALGQAPQQTVAQDVFAPPGAPMQQGVPGGLPAAPPQAGPMAMPPMPRPAAPAMPPPQAPMAAAGGGLLDLPVPDDMFDAGEGEFAGGGLVAFQSGGYTSAQEIRIKQLMAEMNDPNTSRDAKEAARLELRTLMEGEGEPYFESPRSIAQGRNLGEQLSAVGEFLTQPVPGVAPPDLPNIPLGDYETFRGTMQDNLARTGSGDYAAEVEAARQRGEGFSIPLPTITHSGALGNNPFAGLAEFAQNNSIRAVYERNRAAREAEAAESSNAPTTMSAEDYARYAAMNTPRETLAASFAPPPAAQTPPATGGIQNLLAAAQTPPAEQTPAPTPFDQATFMANYIRDRGPVPTLEGMSDADRAAQRKQDIGMALLSAAAAGLQSGSPTLFGALGAAGAGALPAIQSARTEQRELDREDRRAAYEADLAAFGLRGEALKAATDASVREEDRAFEERKFAAEQAYRNKSLETQLGVANLYAGARGQTGGYTPDKALDDARQEILAELNNGIITEEDVTSAGGLDKLIQTRVTALLRVYGGSDSTAGGLNTEAGDPSLWSLVSRGE